MNTVSPSLKNTSPKSRQILWNWKSRNTNVEGYRYINVFGHTHSIPTIFYFHLSSYRAVNSPSRLKINRLMLCREQLHLHPPKTHKYTTRAERKVLESNLTTHKVTITVLSVNTGTCIADIITEDISQPEWLYIFIQIPSTTLTISSLQFYSFLRSSLIMSNTH